MWRCYRKSAPRPLVQICSSMMPRLQLRSRLRRRPNSVGSMASQDNISVHQFHSGSAVADAVTNCMFFVQSMLRGFGFASEIFVEHLHPALSGRLQRLEELKIGEQDLLFIHHSMGHDAFSRLADLRCRKFLVYHNITPPEFFDENDAACSYAIKGYAQLSDFRDIVEAAIAVSPFNARQLARRGFDNVAVIPFLKDFAGIRHAPHSKQPYFDRSVVARLLFVGRIVPHKCQHELIEFIDQVRSIRGTPLGLILVGHCDDASPYKSQLDDMIRRSGLEQDVRLTGAVTDAELFGWYRAASAYVSLSEHEGFGVPLVEAMAFDLPVIAYACTGVSETLSDAGVMISDQSPASILKPLIRLHNDRLFRRGVIRSQRSRLLQFSRKRIERELRSWLIKVGACEATEFDDSTLRDDGATGPLRRTHYVIEGPFEASYSLAIVNRNLALALDEREARSSYIEPADGTEDYRVDPVVAAGLPRNIQDLVRPAPATGEPIVTI